MSISLKEERRANMEMSLATEHKKTILVVDDEDLIRSYLHDLLEDHGYRVFLAADGKAAMRVFEAQNIDLVLTDIVMPEHDGFELIRAFKSEVPIVAMTGHDRIGGVYLNTAELLGAVTVTKPILGLSLLETIRELFEQTDAL